jgi:cobalt-zinc-cadmium efflux system outer membrane protein
MTGNRVFVWVLLLALGPGVAEAAGPESDSVLAALLERAAHGNPEIVAAQARVDALCERVPQVQSQPDPWLSLDYTNDGVSPSLGEREMTTLGLTVRQTLTRPAVRRLRGQVADRAAERAEIELARVTLGVAASVRRAYAELGRAQMALAVVREQGPLWDQIEGSARARYEVGRATSGDWIRVRVERARVQQALTEAVVEVDAAQGELERLTGGGAPSEIALELHPLDRRLDDLIAEGREASPELRGTRVDNARGEAMVSLARASSGLDVALEAGYMNRGGLDPMWQVGVGVSLPVRRARVRAALAEAEAERRATVADGTSVEATLRQRTSERFARLQATAQVAVLYRDTILPQGQLAIDALRAGYETGSVPLYSVLEAMASLGRDRLGYLDALARHEALRASLYEWSLASDPQMAPSRLMQAMPGAGMGPSSTAAARETVPAGPPPAGMDNGSGGM